MATNTPKARKGAASSGTCAADGTGGISAGVPRRQYMYGGGRDLDREQGGGGGESGQDVDASPSSVDVAAGDVRGPSVDHVPACADGRPSSVAGGPGWKGHGPGAVRITIVAPCEPLGPGPSGYATANVKRRNPEGAHIPTLHHRHPGPNGDESDLATVLAAFDRRRDWNGYELLLWATLDDAMTLLTRAGPVARWDSLPAPQRLVAYETKAWIDSDDTSHIFAFVSICDYFGLEGSMVRRGAWSLRGRHVARSRRADVGRTKVGADRQRWWVRPKKGEV